jgi:SpoVK/Ycf46/Vps4 family AAA+-type ATPase
MPLSSIFSNFNTPPTLSLKIIQQQQFQQLQQHIPTNDNFYPSIFMPEHIANQYNILHGSWITIQGPNGIPRAAKIIVFPNNNENDVLSYGWFVFTLQQQHQQLVNTYSIPLPKITITIIKIGGTWNSRHRRIVHDSPPIATSITVSRIKSPQSSGHEDYSHMITRFFTTPATTTTTATSSSTITNRVFRVGDIFTIFPSTSFGSLPNNNNDTPPILDITLCSENGNIPLTSATTNNSLSSSSLSSPISFQITHCQIINTNQFDDNNNENYIQDVEIHPDTTRVSLFGAVNSFIFDPNSYYSNNITITTPLQQEIFNLLLPSITGLPHNITSTLLLCGSKGSGKKTALLKVAQLLGIHCKIVNLTHTRGLPQDRVVTSLQEIFDEAIDVSPCLLVLQDFLALNGDSTNSNSSSGNSSNNNTTEKPDDPDLIANILRNFCFHHHQQQQPSSSNNNNIILTVATCDSTSSLQDLNPILHSLFTHKIIVPPLDSIEKRKICLKEIALERQIVLEETLVEKIAIACAGRTPFELRALFAEAGVQALQKRLQSNNNNNNTSTTNYEFSDFQSALDSLPTSTSIDAPKIPAIFWDDVGGLNDAKQEIIDMIQTQHNSTSMIKSSRSGILLYGPPGTGKTLLAKAVATEFKMNFISVKGPELLDMYIGESERKVRQIFETARIAKPCILFFDELDSLAPQRGRGSDSGGVMDRVVSQLLTEIDGMSASSSSTSTSTTGENSNNNSSVFVIAATNRPDLLDQSLLRPGRFDRLIYLGISQNRDDQKKIIKALTRKFNHSPDVDLDLILNGLPSTNLTGADFYALCSSAMSNALNRRVLEIAQQAKQLQISPQVYIQQNPGHVTDIIVEMQDYNIAKKDLVPSVSESEIQHYEGLRKKFSATSTSNSDRKT